MAKKIQEEGRIDPNYDDDEFYRLVGNLLKFLREKAGFPTPEAFANIIGMSRSQYSAYEAGKNLNLATFRRLMLEFNFKVENWLNLDILNYQNGNSATIDGMKQARTDQLIEQVKQIDGIEAANKLATKEAQRLIDILIYCYVSKSRSEILTTLLKMGDSINTLKRVAGKLLAYGWIEPTDKKNKNNPNQRYVTTEAGKEVLRLGSESKSDEENTKGF